MVLNVRAAVFANEPPDQPHACREFREARIVTARRYSVSYAPRRRYHDVVTITLKKSTGFVIVFSLLRFVTAGPHGDFSQTKKDQIIESTGKSRFRYVFADRFNSPFVFPIIDFATP